MSSRRSIRLRTSHRSGDLVIGHGPSECELVRPQSNVFVSETEYLVGVSGDQLDLACRRRQLGGSSKEERVGDVQRPGQGESPQR